MRQTAPAQQHTLEVAAPIGPQLLRSLRERIIRTELVPGMRLSEQEIAETYTLSRQPVREAFIRLAEEGLVEIRPQRGTFVRKISEADVMDARFVREAIEADIVRLVAETADAHVAADLRDLVARQVEVPDGDPAQFLQLDETFHRTLADAAGKGRAWKILENIKAQMDRVRYLTASEFPKQLLIEQHLAIVDAVERGEGEIAEAAMREHLRKVLSDLPTIIGAYPDFFEPGQQPIE
ncbi:GntR family transcriptional regulator [Rhodovibrio salinarum]|uniref:GntR family transcriptional regulator n=1 Tax=Rhodovibrio salinarum TaxID=1087 RepID=A0A934QM59_9PROT|nr:GntR family transcriptional regulator [Rhodovibrio salinarum]MBK1699139.1 GntR family transcriptional regulator [Rhodovibrio salinarum]